MTTKEYSRSLDSSNQNRARVKYVIDRGNLVDVMYQYEALINGRWTPIVRFDCAHGFFHKDTLYPNGDKVKQKIGISSLDAAAEYAKQDIKMRWQWYRERYIKNIKTK
jgi:hypothetical protein